VKKPAGGQAKLAEAREHFRLLVNGVREHAILLLDVT
jgi:hypothetical protein